MLIIVLRFKDVFAYYYRLIGYFIVGVICGFVLWFGFDLCCLLFTVILLVLALFYFVWI